MLLVWCLSVIFMTMTLAGSEESSKIVSYVSDRNEDGYHFQYSTSDGQQREETGNLKKEGDNVILVVRGFYSYIGSDNKIRKVTYQADEKGYRPIVETLLPPSSSSTRGDYTPSELNSLLNLANEIFTTPPPTPMGMNLAVQRIDSGLIATAIGGGLGKYSTSDDQQREETGHLKREGDNVILEVQGFYTYTGSDNRLRKVTYQADEKGFHPIIETVLLSSSSRTDHTPSDPKSPVNTAKQMYPTPTTSTTVPILRIPSSLLASAIGGGLGK